MSGFTPSLEAIISAVSYFSIQSASSCESDWGDSLSPSPSVLAFNLVSGLPTFVEVIPLTFTLGCFIGGVVHNAKGVSRVQVRIITTILGPSNQKMRKKRILDFTFSLRSFKAFLERIASGRR